MDLILNEDQELAIKEAKLGKNLFITGPGGVGKSVIVNKIRDMFTDTAIILAPTGIASLNIGGATLHSTFGLPFSICTEDDSRKYSEKCLELFRDNDVVKTIIIDEISMVRADIFVTIDKMLRHLKRNDVAFGGLQVILVGDFFQLPPVLTPQEEDIFNECYPSVYAFDTDTWDDLHLRIINLTKVMRQDDKVTVRAFNAIRHGNPPNSVIDWLNKKCKNNIISDEATVLCTTNRKAGDINGEKYEKLMEEEKIYYCKKEGDFRDTPVDYVLRLKVGCKVLICSNANGGYYNNGDTGYIEELEDDFIYVRLVRGPRVRVQKNTWESIEYGISSGQITKIIKGTLTQFPIKLGWAITIHKSQGMTLDECVIDLDRGCFCHGQSYVALSRVRDIEKLGLARNIRMNDVIVDEQVIEFQEYIEGL